MDVNTSQRRSLWSRLGRLGPTIVVAAVVLGPGSIVNASRVGCEFGYSLLWVVPIAGLLMMGMTIAAMTIGVLDSQTPCQMIAAHFGRPAAWLVGVSMLVAITLFQASNNNAMLMAWGGLMPSIDHSAVDGGSSPLLSVAGLLVFNGFVIAILAAGKTGLYRRLEMGMTLLVGVMLVAFTASMWAASPSIAGVLSGLVPQLPAGVAPSSSDVTSGMDMISWLGIAALFATTFSVAGAFFQTYQVREKGWDRSELRTGVIDAVVGIGTLAGMTMILFITSAAALHGRVEVGELTSATAVASQMEPLFGKWAGVIFSVGVFAGAVSSFVVNALIGGVVFVDALGKSSSFDSLSVRRATIGVLLAGFGIAAAASLSGMNLVRFIVVAQSLTVLAFPLLAVVLWWHLGSLKGHPISRWLHASVGLGTVVVFLLSFRTLWSLLSA